MKAKLSRHAQFYAAKKGQATKNESTQLAASALWLNFWYWMANSLDLRGITVIIWS